MKNFLLIPATYIIFCILLVSLMAVINKSAQGLIWALLFIVVAGEIFGLPAFIVFHFQERKILRNRIFFKSLLGAGLGFATAFVISIWMFGITYYNYTTEPQAYTNSLSEGMKETWNVIPYPFFLIVAAGFVTGGLHELLVRYLKRRIPA